MQSSAEYQQSDPEQFTQHSGHIGAAVMGDIQTGERVKSDSELAKERFDALASSYLDDEHRAFSPDVPVMRTGMVTHGAEALRATVLHTTGEFGNFQRSITLGQEMNGTTVRTQVFRAGAAAVSSTRIEQGQQSHGLESSDSVGRLGAAMGTMQWGAIQAIQPKR
jgi:hypothetical protein